MRHGVLVADGVYWIGVNDRVTELFERQWPLPYGMAYNSYVVLGERTALIDTVADAEGMEYLERLEGVLEGRSLDYLIVNHMEPDHTGAIGEVVRRYPGIRVVGNKKTAEIYNRYFSGLGENFQTVNDGEELDLGGGRKLQFYLTPWVHWPETMMTLETGSGVFFTGDAFGSYGALDGAIFDDEMDATRYEDEMLRYYTNIVARYSGNVLKALDKVKDLPFRIIASTHGPIWRMDIGWPVERFRRWAAQEGEPGVVIAVGSMYGSTLTAAEYLARCLTESGVPRVILHDVSKTHVSYILRDAWRYRGLILGSVAYNTEMFPGMWVLCEKLRHAKVANRSVGLFGGASWSGGGVRKLKEFVDEQKGLTLVGAPVEMMGREVKSVADQLQGLAEAMAGAIAE